jgi:hypothetical protein
MLRTGILMPKEIMSRLDKHTNAEGKYEAPYR